MTATLNPPDPESHGHRRDTPRRNRSGGRTIVLGTKRCSRCGEIKPLEEFRRDRKSRDGYGGQCKACNSEYYRQYVAKNREKNLRGGVNPPETKRCSRCGEVKPISEFQRRMSTPDGYRYVCKACCSALGRRYNTCVSNPKCPRVGKQGAEFVTFTCEVCGVEFRRSKSYIDWHYEHQERLPRFCSRACYFASRRKGYKSSYARNIERIKKEVGA